ncbi:hypothetical protein [Hymenobacter persicinus]|uniref:Uncharacterized protein n=1 Tax=Hymenobacter persicinus TaxID=2025506 RepID=A0A4Q5L9F6_9BACT|nr:hypothetical protein [Hymenobacter persicinus]RYU77666.1 hypothetical protein EWM57_17220 [Hymenobacter persicinus]
METLHLAPAPPVSLAELTAYLRHPGPADEKPRRLPPRRDIFNDVINEALHAHFDSKTIRSIHYTINTYVLGFRAAKSGDFSTARVEFARADELLALLEQTHEPRVVAFLRCLTLPYQAYFSYRRGLFDEADAQTYAAIASIGGLEDQIAIFHIARVQQLHNLSRISFRRGEAAAGATLVHELLRYLSAGTAPALAGSWAPALLDNTPAALRADMFAQIFLEMVGNLAQLPEVAQRHHQFTLAFGELADQTVGLDFWPPYQAWLTAYEALLTADEASYVPLLGAFLQLPGHAHDLLKLALLRELAGRRRAAAAAPDDLAAALPTYARAMLWVSEPYLSLLA